MGDSVHGGAALRWVVGGAWRCVYGGSIYACRRCHQLAYKSQRETADDRATRRANKLRERLGWEAGILNGEGGKPKGMHWATFERFKARHDVAVYRSLQGLADRLGLLDGRLSGINARVDALGL